MTERGYEPERLATVFAAVSAAAGDTDISLGGVLAEVVGVKSAGVLLMSANRTIGSVSASDSVTEAIEDLQYTTGNGPCVEAYRTRAPVLSPDLARQRDVAWPEFRAGRRRTGRARGVRFPAPGRNGLHRRVEPLRRPARGPERRSVRRCHRGGARGDPDHDELAGTRTSRHARGRAREGPGPPGGGPSGDGNGVGAGEYECRGRGRCCCARMRSLRVVRSVTWRATW